jgi:hypothetical protein
MVDGFSLCSDSALTSCISVGTKLWITSGLIYDVTHVCSSYLFFSKLEVTFDKLYNVR